MPRANVQLVIKTDARNKQVGCGFLQGQDSGYFGLSDIGVVRVTTPNGTSAERRDVLAVL